MAEYIDGELLIEKMTKLRGCSCSYSDGIIDEVEDIMFDLPTADVVEREKIDKAIKEIEQTLYVDSLIFGELIDFKDGKISADDVIEEFNRVTRKEVLEILKRNIEE